MKAVITVLGKDKVGILYNVSDVLAACDVNILDVNQTILQGVFSMVMITDISKCPISFEDLQKKLDERGKKIGVDIRIQHEGIFTAMSEL